MNLKSQRRMAASILKCGNAKVWIDPKEEEEVSSAMTKADIRRLIQQGIIRKKKSKGQSRARARAREQKIRKGRKRREGSKKGAIGARRSRKLEWISKVRAQRKLLKKLRKEGKISLDLYHEAYRKIKGGYFRNKKHLLRFLNEKKI